MNFTALDEYGWGCIPGGVRSFVIKMLKAIRTTSTTNPESSIYRNAFVKSVKYSEGENDINVVVNKVETPLTFSHVICTASLPSLASVDLSGVGLDFPQKYAVRTARHDHSVKIAVKFKKRWWENPSKVKPPIFGGKSLTDLSLRVIVYPSYGFADFKPPVVPPVPGNEPRPATDLNGNYVNTDGIVVELEQDAAPSYELPGTILAAYVWGRDAEYLASQFTNGHIDLKAPFAQQILSDLAALHNLTLDELTASVDDIFCWDWHGYGFTNGPFSLFNPGQFDQVKQLLKPIAGNRFLFAGEGLSVHHGWTIGCMKSAFIALLHIFSAEQFNKTRQSLTQQWKVQTFFLDSSDPPDNEPLISEILSRKEGYDDPDVVFAKLKEDGDIYLPFDEEWYENQYLKACGWVEHANTFYFRKKSHSVSVSDNDKKPAPKEQNAFSKGSTLKDFTVPANILFAFNKG